MIVRDSEQSAVGLAGVIYESRRPANVHSIAHIFRFFKLVEVKKIVVFIGSLLALIRLVGRDDLPTIRIHELALLEILAASKSPSPILGLEDLDGDFPAPLDNSILAVDTAIAARVAFEDVESVAEELLEQATLFRAAFAVLASFDDAFATRIFQAAALVRVLALVAATFLAALTPNHDIIRSPNHAFSKDALRYELEAGGWRAIVDVV